MAALLDVNVLIALFDPDHPRSDAVADWLTANAAAGWASCAITENGFARIVSQPGYANPMTVRRALGLLAAACADQAHEFWPCDISITDDARLNPGRLLRSGELTDIYLLALAVAHGGRLVTFDRRIALEAVPGATPDHLLVLGSPEGA